MWNLPDAPCYDLCREMGARLGFSFVHTARFRAEDCTDGSWADGQYSSCVMRSNWGCRKCNLLRYASEGGALLHHDRGAFASLVESLCGPVRSDRPEPRLPYVFTSSEEAAEAGFM